MRDATVVTLEAQLDALAARIATLEWRQERELEEQDRQKQLEEDRDETLRDLARRLGRLEARK